MVICFEMDGVSMEMTGQASIVEKSGKDMRRPFLHLTLERPTIEEVGSPPKMIIIDDSSDNDLKTTEGSPMAVDDDGEPGRGLKRQREEDSDDEHPLIFKHMKRTNTENVLETSEDEEGVDRDAWHGVRVEEGPSDPYAEVWEKVWDEELARVFQKHDWAQEETKILGDEGARNEEELGEPEEEFVLPEDPNDIALEPRFDIDSVVESNSYISDEEDGEESIEWVNLLSESDYE